MSSRSKTESPTSNTGTMRTSLSRCGECEACKRPDCLKCDECPNLKFFPKSENGPPPPKKKRGRPRSKESGGGKADSKGTKEKSAATKPPAVKRSKRQALKAAPSFEETDDDSDDAAGGGTYATRGSSSASSTADKSKPPGLRPLFESLIQVPDDAEAPLREDNLLGSDSYYDMKAAKTRPRLDTAKPQPPTHYAGKKVPSKLYQVCAVCGSDEDNGGTIVLCDGPGCNQEFHMVCCRPPLTVVPEGDFYCFDCSPEGATEPLRRYLDNVEAQREAYFEQSSFSFVDQLIFQDMKEHQPSLFEELTTTDSEGKDDGTTDNDLELAKLLLNVRPPVSELDKFHAGHLPLVGKVIRLFCPESNDYHTGRILKVRSLTKTTPEDLSSFDNEMLWDSECLVRFQAGGSNRKATLLRWVRLEEHSLALCSDIVWALHTPSPAAGSQEGSPNTTKAKSEWLPTKLWMRSSRELVMSLHMLEEEVGQIRYRDWRLQNEQRMPTANFGSDDQSWILGELIGKETYKLLHVFATRNSSFFSSGQHTTTNGNTPHGTQPPSAPTNGNSPQLMRSTSGTPAKERPVDRMLQIMVALAEAERQEQDRVHEWIEGIPLQNSLHPRALTCHDESTLGPLGDPERPVFVQPSPLVRRGLDRIFVLDQVAAAWQNEYKATTGETVNYRTKDVAMSLSCTLLDRGSTTACIQDQNAKERRIEGIEQRISEK